MDALMKKILSFVLVTFLTVSSVSFALAVAGNTGSGGAGAPQPPSEGTSNTGTVVDGTVSGGTVVGGTTSGGTSTTTDDCGPIRSKMTVSNEVAMSGSQPIVAYLTENFESITGVNMPCGRIIQCLRTHPDFVSKKTPTRVQEYIINETLIGQFPACVIYGDDGLSLLNNYASRVYQWIAGIVGAICILIIVVSGIQISIGGLSPEEVGSAKERVERALIGLAVLFLSAFILYTINPTFFT